MKGEVDDEGEKEQERKRDQEWKNQPRWMHVPVGWWVHPMSELEMGLSPSPKVIQVWKVDDYLTWTAFLSQLKYPSFPEIHFCRCRPYEGLLASNNLTQSEQNRMEENKGEK